MRMVTATKIVNRLKEQFNYFKTPQDRKYFVYEVFGFMKRELGYTVEKLIGSNQVILTKIEERTLYNSDSEGELADPQKFEQFILEELRSILRKIR